MIIHELRETTPAAIFGAMARFEEQFRYPLGPGRSFRVSHGKDYARFYRSIGEEACFAAERNGKILGVMGAVLRRLTLPSGESRSVVYLGDVKVDPSARGGRVLLRLVDAVRQWVHLRATSAYSVVLEGTLVDPTRYTGRLGIPDFSELGRITVLRVSTSGSSHAPEFAGPTTEEQGAACFARLTVGWYCCAGGDPTLRSEMEPTWLVARDGRACGRLEDTLRAKRFITDDGVEMRCAHLACFAYSERTAGIALLRAALHHAFDRGFTDLFVTIPFGGAKAFREAFSGVEVVVVPVTIFGSGLEPGSLWCIHPSEM